METFSYYLTLNELAQEILTYAPLHKFCACFVDRTGNKNPVDEVKYEELCGRATVSEVLNCHLLDVTGFPGFHLVVQNVVQLCSQY